MANILNLITNIFTKLYNMNFSFTLKYFKYIIIILLASNLISCASSTLILGGGVASVTGVATTAVLLNNDPRTLGTIIDDRNTQNKLQSFASDQDKADVQVFCYNANAILVGQVQDYSTRDRIDFEAKSSAGIRKIFNFIEVKPTQSLWIDFLDNLNTAQLRTKLMFIKNIDTNAVKVFTNNETIYLMGIVTPQQADDIAQAASKIGGIKKVRTLFQYVAAN